MEGVFDQERDQWNVSVKVVSFFNGRYIRYQERCQPLQLPKWICYQERVCQIGDQERVCQALQLLQGRVLVFMIKNVSVKLFNFFNGGIIDDQERVCETIQFLQWRVY